MWRGKPSTLCCSAAEGHVFGTEFIFWLWQATFTTANTLVLQNASATALFYGKGTHCASSLPAWHAVFIRLALSFFMPLLTSSTYPLALSSQHICPLQRCGKVYANYMPAPESTLAFHQVPALVLHPLALSSTALLAPSM